MVNDTTLRTIATIFFIAFSIYVYASVALFWAKRMLSTTNWLHRTLNFLWRWSKWPALVWVIMEVPFQIMLREDINGWDYLYVVLSLWIWWFYRNSGDDDPWDRLKDKVTEKVEEVRGRLVVVPA